MLCAHCLGKLGPDDVGKFHDDCRAFALSYLRELRAMCQEAQSSIPPEMFRNARAYRRALGAENEEKMKGE